MKNSSMPTSRVRFSGRLQNSWPAAKSWYIDLIKYNRGSLDSFWQIFKTFNWDVVGMYYPTSYNRFKNLHEFQEWLFIERL